MTSTATTTKECTAVIASVSHRLRHALSDIFARVYLGICAVLLVGAYVVTATDSSDESMAGVIPALATAPASLVMLVLPDHRATIVVGVAFGALVNATVIGLCSRALRHRNSNSNSNSPDPASR
ncbi:SCO4225 family membrane protein [Streptomyces sp. NPDC050433]|uniref:SCO4225 family membrane protein n=1 Tax=unclassified Streptomyces TaxID=2593676 RepID=UPI00341DF54D